MKLKPAEEIAAEFMIGNGPDGRHFCDREDCTCTKRLAEIIQWARRDGAETQRRRDARSRIHVMPEGHRIGEALAETRKRVARAK